MNNISAEVPDWTREQSQCFWSPSKKLLRATRDYQKYTANTGFLNKLLKKLAVLRHRFWTVITGADIPLNCQIGGGVLIPHPNGIVIHSAAMIGPNCLIHQQVTIGVKSSNDGAPIIAGHVDIGAGAKIIGHITIGKHAQIGANAVVTKDVPDFAIVAGVPAKVIGSTKEMDS
ncbi:serine acetyltransferase [Methylophaga aminisulfidivorans MP]|uniref:Serine acetyltransferase n=1 Tax=Methylophaga aminisulfidivorans MP TaxID=1026882 RepID=F5T2W5_9GAMM|nr:serine O-acetyltransferase [Methylophaga aminisulfidivorans]EGL53326.1 serine acetyltransferase [Methylophaga aminisulfidivorans MP]